MDIGLLVALVAAGIASLGLGVNGYRLWIDHLAPFRVSCELQGLFWVRPEGRPESMFAVIAPVHLRNEGARPGVIDAAFVRLIGPLPEMSVEFRLDATVTVSPNTPFLMAKGDDIEQARNIKGIRGYVALGSHEEQEVGFHCTFAPSSAKRWAWFGQPRDRLQDGRYKTELWLHVGGDWASYSEGEYEMNRALLEALGVDNPLAVNISGTVFDYAPGAPGVTAT